MTKKSFNLRIVAMIACLVVTGMMLAGCNKNNEPSAISVADVSSLTQEVFADNVCGNSSISFTTTGSWTSNISTVAPSALSPQMKAKADSPEWISISPESGLAGAHTVDITLETNQTGEDRAAIITFSCNGTDISATVTQRATLKGGVPYEPNVYVAGWERNAQGHSVAKVWINGVPHALSDGNYDAQALSVFVYGGIVRVAGWETNENGEYVATLWVDGVAQRLSSQSSQANSVYVSNTGVVYVAGRNYGSAALWTNGSLTTLLEGTDANSVYVSNTGTVYVGGSYGVGQFFFTYSPRLWIDGNNVSESHFKGGGGGYIQSVFVFENNDKKDIYTSGHRGSVTVEDGRIWKNGEIIFRGYDYLDIKEITSVFVSNDNVYATGYGNVTVGKVPLWVNGVMQSLGNTGTTAWTNSVYVVGSKHYVAGNVVGDNFVFQAAVWKNGDEQRLTNGTNESSANSVFAAW